MVLPYRVQKQILTQWCWAAVSSSISKCYNEFSSWSQNKIASVQLKQDCSVVFPPSSPAELNQLEGLNDALVITGNYAGILNRPLKLAEIILQIKVGRPIGCQIARIDGQTHFVCLFGYNADTFALYIGDPAFEGEYAVRIIAYEEFKDNYDGGRWVRSYPTQPKQNLTSQI
ncbi:MAG: papain-like cysteine protease family protein [Pedobacter sp.]|nr:papain-like cysteine protease family protein [Pedobacter sp.]MDQ8052549.1 papain-like cysteine protease family protein [Pedobacter sp.]